MMSRYFLICLLLVGTVAALACSSSGPETDPMTPITTGRVAAGDNHQIIGAFEVVFDVGTETAEIVWKRVAEGHHNVTRFMQPPQCFDCVIITDASYQPFKEKWSLEIQFRNPKNLTGYDVRAVLSNPGGNKFLLNSDGITQLYGPAMQFVAIGAPDTRTFPPQSAYKTWFEFYYPDGEKWSSVEYLIDAGFPGHVREPLIENGIADELVNNNYSMADIRCWVWDHQGGIQNVTVDLLPLGGSPMTMMYDDGQHCDGGPGDHIYGAVGVKTGADLGWYMLNVIAFDAQQNMGMGQIPIHVVDSLVGENKDPIIQGVDVDRTTAKGPGEKINITVNAIDPDGSTDDLQFDFQCGSGMFSGQDGGSITWTPSASKTGPQLITVHVYDPKGGEDSAEFHLYSTSLSVINGTTGGMVPTATLESVIPVATLHMATDFMGEVLYLNFWATWCPPCVGELPHLTQMFNKYSSNPGYNHVMVDVGESASKVENFVNSSTYAASYWALDPSSSYFGQCAGFNGGSGSIPQHALFDRDGRCRWSHIAGVSSTTEIENAIDQLL